MANTVLVVKSVASQGLRTQRVAMHLQGARREYEVAWHSSGRIWLHPVAGTLPEEDADGQAREMLGSADPGGFMHTHGRVAWDLYLRIHFGLEHGDDTCSGEVNGLQRGQTTAFPADMCEQHRVTALGTPRRIVASSGQRHCPHNPECSDPQSK
nr:hypothetical protein CFP56_63974 [Quercus suber]